VFALAILIGLLQDIELRRRIRRVAEFEEDSYEAEEAKKMFVEPWAYRKARWCSLTVRR
jgi:hypothetical protein